MEASAVSDQDREALKRFLERVRGLLDYLARDPHEIFKPELAPLVESAWEELVAEERFEQAVRQIDSPEGERGLVEHGLRGAQLKLKIAAFDQSLAVAQRHSRKRFFSKERLQGSVPVALEAANVTIDSVAAFVPPVAAVAEFKKAVEVAIAKRAMIRSAIGKLNPKRLLRKKEKQVLAEAV